MKNPLQENSVSIKGYCLLPFKESVFLLRIPPSPSRILSPGDYKSEETGREQRQKRETETPIDRSRVTSVYNYSSSCVKKQKKKAFQISNTSVRFSSWSQPKSSSYLWTKKNNLHVTSRRYRCNFCWVWENTEEGILHNE